jgi:hypothetical protein
MAGNENPLGLASHAADLLIACHAEHSFDLYSLMCSEMEEDDAAAPFEMNTDEDEFVYIYGFDVAEDGCNKAWRLLIDADGEEVIEKELASHISSPPEGIGIGFFFGHWLDGSMHEIPGLLAETQTNRKRKSDSSAGAAIKRPAAAPESQVHDAELSSAGSADFSEEMAEEEQDFEKDIEIEPEPLHPMIGKYVQTTSLQDESLNDLFWQVDSSREDGRLLIVKLPPADPQQFWAAPEKLISVTTPQLVPRLQTSIGIGGQTFSIKACTQGERPAIVKVQSADGKQLGMVSSKATEGDIVEAFKKTIEAVACLQQAYNPAGESMKQQFFQIRNDLFARNC